MQNKSYTTWVGQYVRHYWYLLAGLLLVSLGAVAFELISPLPLKFLADNVFGGNAPPSFIGTHDRSYLLVLASVAYVGIYFLQSLYRSLQSLVRRKFSQIIDKATMTEAYQSVGAVPYNNQSRQDAGTYLYQITNQSQQMSEYLFSNIVPIAQSVIALVGIILILAQINLNIMLITFSTIPLLAVAVVYFGKLLQSRANQTELAHAKVYAFINDSITKLRTIQAFALNNKRLLQLNGLVDVRNRRAVSQLVSSETFDLSAQIVILSGTALAIYLGGISVFKGVMTFGGLLIFIAYINDVFDHVSNIIANIDSMKIQAAALQQSYDTINEANTKKSQSGTLKEPIKGQLEFRDITISQGAKQVLQSVNLTIPAGTVVAFVGMSGGGKTTMLNSILRFVVPDRGHILLDGHDIRDFDLTYLRQHIALIDQEPDLFELSIKDNIAIAEVERQYNLPDVMGSAVIANAADFIEKQPNSYDQIVDNNALSGGQKQRIAVARAFYKNAPVVLMDEPTSALDRKAADTFVNNVLGYFKDRTLIIITHDLSLLKHIPTIYVVQDQKVVPIKEVGGLEAYGRSLESGKD
jgi:ATP-binding cassette subfamily B protein